uniref:Putative STE3-like pheromone receptor STE3_Mr5 n=1 Tax=Moniliophthora roreri TaxID=221103 RepID=A0A0W0FUR9_MONRR
MPGTSIPYPNSLFSSLSFLGFVLVSTCLPWDLQAWNAGACLYILWTSLACLNQFVNSVVWTGNVVNRAPIWCAISAKFIIGSTSALPACSLCINRRVYMMLSTNTFPITRKERLRALIEELAIGLGIPIVHMALHYVPQDHTFDILEDIGCYPFPYHNTWISFVLYSCWPLVIGSISAIYSVMNLVIINKASLRVHLFLSSDNKSMDWARYWRLTLLACVQMLTSAGICAYLMFSSIHDTEIFPWIPASVWRNWRSVNCVEVSRWTPAMCALLYFAIFGTSREARKTYRNVYGIVRSFKLRSRRTGQVADTALQVQEGPRPGDQLSDYTSSAVSTVVLDVSPEHAATNL